jgi:hypothetical protein
MNSNIALFFNDKLKQLLNDEVMNIHHPISPSATIRLFNAPIQGTQAIMHPSLGNMVVLIKYQLVWQPLVTPLYQVKTMLSLHLPIQ